MYHGFYTYRGRKFPHGNFRTSVFCEVKTQIVGKTLVFRQAQPPRRAVFDLLTVLPRDTFQLPRGSAHKIAFALQTHKNRGRGPGHLLLPLRGNSPCVPRFLYFKREKVSERELSDVRVRPDPNTLVGKAKAFRQGKKNPVPKGTGFSSHLRISPEKLRLPGMRQRRYHNLHKRLR